MYRVDMTAQIVVIVVISIAIRAVDFDVVDAMIFIFNGLHINVAVALSRNVLSHTVLGSIDFLAYLV